MKLAYETIESILEKMSLMVFAIPSNYIEKDKSYDNAICPEIVGIIRKCSNAKCILYQDEGKEEDQVEMPPEEGGSGNIIRDGPENYYPEIIVKPRSPELADNSSRTNHNEMATTRNCILRANYDRPIVVRHVGACIATAGLDDENDVDEFLVLKPAHAALGPKPDLPREKYKVLSEGN
ncbi:hypothetical protein CASFOL_009187 [Castilleja foliolosa]|uniref:Uncharacterized protein n=1 Tax=Castilleja foliolosa TaxID=1961234 RepID=A0ABD3DWJ2_9LAMI